MGVPPESLTSGQPARIQVGNSTPASVLQRTTGVLQQSEFIVQGSPRSAPVQAPQSSGALEQTLPPMPSLTHAQPQQSASAVQGWPSMRHIAPQRSTPIASGTQMPPQQTSPKAHSAPSGRQHRMSPPTPGEHMMSGYRSMQHSEVIVQISPGSVHMPSPPRQRRTPMLAGSQPVSPPPSGQQLRVVPMPQTSPAGTHEPVFAQRMIGEPSTAMPAMAQLSEQHCPESVHGSSCIRQPPSG